MLYLNKWDKRFLKLAEHVAQWSKDPSTQVGAVIADPYHRVLAIGYNGLPRGVPDKSEWLDDRTKKYQIILHAEHNAILTATAPLLGTRLYTWPFQPCAHCASIILQSGIKEVVAPNTTHERLSENFELAQELFDAANKKLILIDIEHASFDN